MTRLAQLICKEEGFGIVGSVPTRDHNPGDLRHAPHAAHTISDPNGIGSMASDDLGWEDLERQLLLYSQRGLTLKEAIYEFAPPNENNSALYLANVIGGFGGLIGPSTPLVDVLKIRA